MTFRSKRRGNPKAAPESWMPKRLPRDPTASDLTVRERILLFCGASGTDWQRAGVPGETVIGMTVRGLGPSPGRISAS